MQNSVAASIHMVAQVCCVLWAFCIMLPDMHKHTSAHAGLLCTWTACIGSIGTPTCLRGAVASRCSSAALLSPDIKFN